MLPYYLRFAQILGKVVGHDECKALVLVGCLDEIFFHGCAVLVGVEPASMVWFLGKKVGKLRGSVSGPSNCGLGTPCNTSSPMPAGPCKRGSPKPKRNGGNTVKTWLRPWT